jgi:hypothetical protein
MRTLVLFLAAISLFVSGTAQAEKPGTIVRLSAAEAEAAKEAAAKRNTARADQPIGPDGAVAEDRAPLFGPIHGEVGFGIGTGGYRELFGAAALPIGEKGGFSFAFDSLQLDRERRRVRR